VKAAESALSKLADTSKIRSSLTQARRALTSRKPNPKKAILEAGKAVKTYQAELVWRTRAARELATPLVTYDKAIALTIGLRQQDRLPTSQVSDMASCLAIHRDISLNF
jgi:hypothetical protein